MSYEKNTHIFTCIIEGEKLEYHKTNDSDTLIAKSGFVHQNYSKWTLQFSEFLISKTGNFLYPIVEGIVYALPETILIKKNKNYKKQSSCFEKSIQVFYDKKGWAKHESMKVFEDAKRYEDLREVSENYVRNSRSKIENHINDKGRYLLDAASGPIQFDEYLAYSRNFSKRICVDISIQALKQAKEKCQGQGIFILADLCNLPICSGVIDSVVSLNTIYHIPKNKQLKAIQELYRILIANGRGVIVYSWGRNAWLMRFATLPRVVAKKIKKLGELLLNKSNKQLIEPDIYFYAHQRSFFNKNNLGFKVEIHSWRLLSVPFMRYYIHNWLGGKYLLKFAQLIEERFPIVSGKLSEYPMIFFTKTH